MSVSFSGFTTDNNINTYSQTSLSQELFNKGAVSFADNTYAVSEPSSFNFIYSNYNYMYQRYFS